MRTSLVTELVTSVTKEWSAGCLGEWLPESVWVARGFLKETVQNCDSKENPKLGLGYQVPVEQENFRVLRRDVEQTLLRKEEDVSKAKASKNAEAAQAGPAEDWSLGEAAPAVKGFGKGGGRKAGEKASGDKPVSKAASAKVCRQNSKLNLKAQKALADLTSATLGLEKLQKQTAAREDLPEGLKEGVNEALAQLGDWKKQCQGVTLRLQFAAVSAQEVQPLLAELPFDDAQLKEKLKAVKALRLELPKREKPEPKAAAATAQGEQPKKRRRWASLGTFPSKMPPCHHDGVYLAYICSLAGFSSCLLCSKSNFWETLLETSGYCV